MQEPMTCALMARSEKSGVGGGRNQNSLAFPGLCVKRLLCLLTADAGDAKNCVPLGENASLCTLGIIPNFSGPDTPGRNWISRFLHDQG